MGKEERAKRLAKSRAPRACSQTDERGLKMIKEDTALLLIAAVMLLYGFYNAFLAHDYVRAGIFITIGVCGLIWTRYKINRSKQRNGHG